MQPIGLSVLEIIIFYLCYLGILIFVKTTARLLISVVVFVFSVALILYCTIINRGGCYEVVFLPFYSFVEARWQPEIFRTLIMNIVLFVPLGVSLPFVISNNVKHPIILALLISISFSTIIEFCQLLFHLGRCEFDDVLANSIGSFLGETSYMLFLRIRCKFDGWK